MAQHADDPQQLQDAEDAHIAEHASLLGVSRRPLRSAPPV